MPITKTLWGRSVLYDLKRPVHGLVGLTDDTCLGWVPGRDRLVSARTCVAGVTRAQASIPSRTDEAGFPV